MLVVKLLKSPFGGGDGGNNKDDCGMAVGGFFLAIKKMLSAPFLTPAETKISVLLSTLVERFSVSRMRDFYYLYNQNIHKCLVPLLKK